MFFNKKNKNYEEDSTYIAGSTLCCCLVRTGLSCLFAGNIDLDGSSYGAVSTWYILGMKDEVYLQSNYVSTLNTFYWPVIEKVVE